MSMSGVKTLWKLSSRQLQSMGSSVSLKCTLWQSGQKQTVDDDAQQSQTTIFLTKISAGNCSYRTFLFPLLCSEGASSKCSWLKTHEEPPKEAVSLSFQFAVKMAFHVATSVRSVHKRRHLQNEKLRLTFPIDLGSCSLCVHMQRPGVWKSAARKLSRNPLLFHLPKDCERYPPFFLCTFSAPLTFPQPSTCCLGCLSQLRVIN